MADTGAGFGTCPRYSGWILSRHVGGAGFPVRGAWSGLRSLGNSAHGAAGRASSGGRNHKGIGRGRPDIAHSPRLRARHRVGECWDGPRNVVRGLPPSACRRSRVGARTLGSRVGAGVGARLSPTASRRERSPRACPGAVSGAGDRARGIRWVPSSAGVPRTDSGGIRFGRDGSGRGLGVGAERGAAVCTHHLGVTPCRPVSGLGKGRFLEHLYLRVVAGVG